MRRIEHGGSSMKINVYLVNKRKKPLLKEEVEVPFIPRIGDRLIILAEAYQVKDVVIDTDSSTYYVNIV